MSPERFSHFTASRSAHRHWRPLNAANPPHAPAGDPHPALWTEEYQAEIYRDQIAMLNKIPQLRGTSPWLLMDFRSARRVNPGLQDNFNRKGLIPDQGVKKQAFFILQKAYKEKTLGKPE
jgi:beta-glucuronidase